MMHDGCLPAALTHLLTVMTVSRHDSCLALVGVSNMCCHAAAAALVWAWASGWFGRLSISLAVLTAVASALLLVSAVCPRWASPETVLCPTLLP